MTTHAYFDAPAGIAGDMCLGALVDAGWPLERLREVVRALDLADVEVEARRTRRGPLAATKVDVLCHGHVADQSPHRHDDADPVTLARVTGRIERASTLPEAARAGAVRAFAALAEAEGRVHGETADRVHFHEVGAADALVDVVGTCTALVDLGVAEVRVSPLPFGGGSVTTAHGALALPAPATVELLAGHPLAPSDERHEQVTPTGAAIVKALAKGHTVWPGFTVRSVGVGAGAFEGGRLPNAVRLLLGDLSCDTPPGDAVLLEANLDDATGQEIARALEHALEAGALDAWATPIVMKKGRPGTVVSVLARPEDVARLESLLFVETPTLGVRRRAVERTVLARRHEIVSTPYGDVRMKVRETPAGPAATPEYEDARRRADERRVPLRDVLDAARVAWRARTGRDA